MTSSPASASSTTRAPRWRWMVPVAALVATVGVGSALTARPADADPNLPPRTAEQLVADVTAARVDGLSGTVSERADVGLPDLGGLGEGAAQWQQLLSGTNTARVWQAGDSSRVSLQDGTQETSVYLTKDQGWVWSSRDQTATKINLAQGAGRSERSKPTESALTPQQAAAEVLKATKTDSTVTVSRGSIVAGRSAYELVVTPKQTDTLVDRVEIAIDGETHVPLQVEVFGVNRPTASIQVGFTDVTFTVPDASVFAFTPPPGATVKEKTANDHQQPARGDKKSKDDKASKPDRDAVKQVGSGWSTVRVLDTGSALSPEVTQQLQLLPAVSGAWGSGRLFSGPLFSAVVSTDGRIAVGAVAPEKLYDALS